MSITLILSLLLGAICYRGFRADPLIRGTRLSKHLKQCEGGLHFGGSSFDGEEITVPDVTPTSRLNSEFDVLSEIGPETLPLLVRLLSGRESKLNLGLRWLAQRHNFFERFIRGDPDDLFAQQVGALLAIRKLGRDAAPAVPSIVELLNDPDIALLATIALIHIQPERESDILALTNVLQISRVSKRGVSPEALHSSGILALGELRDRASGAIPLLTNTLHAKNARVRAASAVALARIGAPAEIALPTLINRLSETNANPFSVLTGRSMFGFDKSYEDMVMNIWAVGEYGPQAHSALPALSNLLEYIVVNAREAAEVAIRKINQTTDHSPHPINY